MREPYFTASSPQEADDLYAVGMEKIVPRLRQSAEKWPRRWDRLGVGPVRGFYYEELVNPNKEFEPSRFLAQGGVIGSKGWFVHDLYLWKILKSLGVSWLRIERAMLDAFLSLMPERFLSECAGFTGTQLLIAWQNSWLAFHWATDRWTDGGKAVDGLKALTRAAKLYEMVRNARNAEDEPFMSKPEREALLSLWSKNLTIDRIRDRAEEFIRFSTPTKSVLLNASIPAVVDSLWEGVKSGGRSELPAIQKIIDKKRAWEEWGGDEIRYFRPKEFWQLVADLLNHCEIVWGLPDDRRLKFESREERTDTATIIRTSGVTPHFLTYEAVKNRYNERRKTT